MKEILIEDLKQKLSEQKMPEERKEKWIALFESMSLEELIGFLMGKEEEEEEE